MPRHRLAGHAPIVADDAWVAPSADLIGQVVLDPRASVWFGAVIRADNTAIRVGLGSNVQDGAVLHSDPGHPLVVGAGCTIGHRAILHGCTIGDGALVGMGAVVLNGATVGADCLVGAGALLTEGRHFGAGQLIVGAPARAVRALTADEIAGLRRSAEGYVERAACYAEALEPTA